MCVEFLLFSNEGDIAKNTITSLLVQGCQDSIIMGAGLTKPLTCQHFLNAERGKGKEFIKTVETSRLCHKYRRTFSKTTLFDNSWKEKSHEPCQAKIFIWYRHHKRNSV